MEADTLERAERKRIDNTRYSKPGRPLATPNLPPITKAAIVHEKNLQLLTRSMIAKEYNVSRTTVATLTEDQLSPEAKAHLKSFSENLTEARDKTLARINEKLDKDAFKDGCYSNLFNVLNTNKRLDDGLSTQNIATSSKLDNIIEDMRLAEGWDKETTIEFFRQNPEIASKHGIIISSE